MGFLVLLFGGVVALDSSIHPTAMEHRFTNVLRSELRQVGQVEVHLSTRSAMRAANGDITRLDIALRDFRLEEMSLTELVKVASPTPASVATRLVPDEQRQMPGVRCGVRPVPADRADVRHPQASPRLAGWDAIHRP